MALVFRLLRVAITIGTVALGMASIQQLKHVNAQGLCPSCGCPGGTTQCCTQGTITCYTGSGQ